MKTVWWLICVGLLFSTIFALPNAIQAKGKTRDWLEVQAVNEDFQKLKIDIVAKLIPLIDSLAKR
jgi:arsenate reductase